MFYILHVYSNPTVPTVKAFYVLLKLRLHLIVAQEKRLCVGLFSASFKWLWQVAS